VTDPLLVIGGAGLVGRHVAAARDDRELVVTHHRVAVPGGVPLDVTEPSAVRALVQRVRPAAVVLAAAAPHVEGCERDPAGTRHINVAAAETVRDVAREIGALLVVFSSEYVFDGTAGPGYREDDARHAINEYGRQKIALEDVARAYDRHLILRVSGVFGDEPERKNFVLQLVDRLRSGGRFRVPSDQLITPTDAASLGRVVLELIDRRATGTYHAAGPRIMRRMEFAYAIARAFDLPSAQIDPTPTADLGLLAPRPHQAGLSDAKLRSLLGHGLVDHESALRELALTRAG